MNLKNTLIGIDGLKAKGNLDVDIKGIESNCDKIGTIEGEKYEEK